MTTERSLGPYRLVALLDEGGMGEVWEGYHRERPKERVALKRVKAADQNDPARTRRFLDEARIGAALNHPNIARTLDLGLEGETPYLVMELLEGLPLSAIVCRPDPLPVGLVVAIGVQALAGLDHAFNAIAPNGKPLRLVHRDLKPSNLFLTRQGVVKIIDFGIARASAFDSTTTRTGILRGSVAYCSPEMVRCEPLDLRSDLFSLGLVLHELLTGRRVFDQDTEAGVLATILFGAVPRVLSRRNDVPASLDEVISWATKRQPDQRPSSPAEMARALERSIPAEAIWTPEQIALWVAEEGRQPAPRPPTGTFDVLAGARRQSLPRRAWLAGLIVLVTLASLGAVGWIAQRTPGNENVRVAVEPPSPADAGTSERMVSTSVAPPAPEPAKPPPLSHPAKRRAPAPAQAEALGWLTIDSRPTWARIRLNGRDLGPTPVYRQPLPQGRYTLEAVRSDGNRQTRQVRIKAGREQKEIIFW